ncbi:hypothetical protein C3E98_040945, partial [Pseudomonas sp. MWU13-2625]
MANWQGVSMAAMLLILQAARAGGFSAGMEERTIFSPARGGNVSVSVWYPASGDTPARVMGASPIFEGVAAAPGADMAAGRHHLLLLAHGGLRAAAGQGDWLAGLLAEHGYIVLNVQAPRAGDAQAAARDAWLRAADLSAALDAVL